MRSVLIGVAGLSGSGKTALSRQVAARLGDAEILSLDSYYHPQSHLSLDERASLNYDHPDALDWELLTLHLEALSRSQSIEEPHYLFDQHTRAASTRRIEPKPYLILEGILALHRPEVRALLDRKIFVETNPDECFRRRMDRDIVERGRTRESVIEQYERTVWPMALEYVLPCSELADLVVSGESPIDHAVERAMALLQRKSAAAY